MTKVKPSLLAVSLSEDASFAVVSSEDSAAVVVESFSEESELLSELQAVAVPSSKNKLKANAVPCNLFLSFILNHSLILNFKGNLKRTPIKPLVPSEKIG